MATLKPIVLHGKIHVNEKGESNIKIEIIHKGKVARIRTDYYIPSKLLGKNGKVKDEHPNASRINAKLSEKMYAYERKLLDYDEKYLNSLSVNQIKSILTGEDSIENDFFGYSAKRIQELRDAGKEGTANSYEDSVKRLKEFANISWLPFASIDKRFLENFTAQKKKEGKSINSIGVYLRSIRALFNDAIEDLNKDGKDPLIKNYPFRKFKIETAPTKFRSIELDILKKISDVELTGMEAIARDICMLIFYLIGINVKDLFYNKGLEKDRFNYTRYKGKKKYSIKIEPEAREILNKYKGEKYLLKFADNCSEVRTPGNMKPHERHLCQYKDHRAFNKMLNDNLKEIVKTINTKHNKDTGSNKDLITDELTTYYFRYAWGNIAREVCNISMDDISLGYGHQKDNLKITGIYVREKLKLVDEANRKVLNALKK